MSRVDYYGHDVHAYSPLLKEYIKTLKIDNTTASVVIGKLDKLVELYGKQLISGIDNIKRNIRNDNIHDPELPGFNTLGLLDKIIDTNPGLLKETLIEIGNTCIQGISHRLLALYHAL